VDFVLHVRASMQAKQVNVRFRVPSQVRVVVGGLPWSGSLAAGQTLDLPVSVIIKQAGEFTLSATVEATDFNQSKMVWMNFLATPQGVHIGTEPAYSMRMRLMTPAQRRQFLMNASRASSNVGPVAPHTR